MELLIAKRITVLSLAGLLSCAAHAVQATSAKKVEATPPAASGQKASGQEAPYSIRARSQYVLVPVVVTDKKGNFKSGLKQEDFKISDEGKEVAIASIEEINASGAPLRRAAPPASDVYDNYLVGEGVPKRLIIVAIDLINTPFFDEAKAREAVFKYLSANLDGNAVIQLVAISGKGVKVLHDFTDDPRILIAALRKVSIGRKANAADAGTSTTDPMGESDPTLVRLAAAQLESMNALVERNSSYQQRLNTQDTLIALQHIAQASAGLPGRKSLIWIGTGLPFPRFSMKSSVSGDVPMSSFERTMEMLSNANVAVYPVNAKGLFDPGYRDASVFAVGNQALDRERYAATIDSMVQFAATTGGKAYFDRNDIENAIQEASQDSARYYLLSYPMRKDKQDFGWRKLKVEVKVPDVRVRARSGYYYTEGTVEPMKTRQVDILNALNSPVNYTAIPLSLKWGNQSAEANGKKKVSFDLRIPGGILDIDGSQANLVSFDVAMTVRNEKENEAARFWQEIKAHPKEEGVAVIRRDGVNYRNQTEVPPGNYQVRLVVRDNISGKVGSLTAPLQVQ